MDSTKGFTPFQIGLTAAFAILAILGLLFFATFQGGSSKGPEIGPVVIWGTLPQTAMQDTIDAMAGEDEQYAEVSYAEQPAATFSRELADAIASGNGPDLIVISQEMLQEEKPKLTVIPFSSISQRTYLDSYLPLFELFLTSDGTYGVPLVLDPLVLYYNRPLLTSAAVASVPTTWEAVAGLAPAITRTTDAGGIVQSLVAFGEYTNVQNARAILSLLLLQSGTTITAPTGSGVRAVFADDSQSSFGSTPAQSAVSFYTQFADPAKTLYSWNRSLPSSRQAFLAGDVALYPGFASELPYLEEANPNLDFDMAAIPNPGTSAGNRMTYGMGYAFAIPKASKNVAGAGGVAFAFSEAAPAKILAARLSMAPARRASLSVASDDKYGAIFYPEALVAKGWLSPSPSDTDAIFSAMIGDIASGRRTLDKALSTASQAITEALR